MKAGLDEAQQIIQDDAPVIFGNDVVPVPDYLVGYVPQTTYDGYPCKFSSSVHSH